MITDLERTESALTGRVNFPHKEKLFQAAENCGMTLEIIKRRGIPAMYLRYRKRFGIPCGILIFMIISAVLYSALWSIDISGTSQIPTESIMETLSDAGIHTGVFCDTVDCREVEYILYKAYPGLSWVNVHIVGARMYVDIREVSETEDIKSPQYSNIVASKDGEIINAEIFLGEGRIYPGTAVVKGDLLVSGVVNHRDGSVKFVDSNAQIFARTKSFVLSRMAKSITISRPSECKVYYFPEFFGISIAELFNVKEHNFTITKAFIADNDVVMPVGIARRFQYCFVEEKIELNESEAFLLCFRDFAASALKMYKSAQVIEKNISIDTSDGTEIYGEYLTVEDIALKKTFTVEAR